MQVVIKIPDDIYEDIKEGYVCSEYADDILKSV